MEWPPHPVTYCGSALFAGIGGLWAYLMTHRKWDQSDCLVAVGYSATFGFAASLIACWFYRCESDNSGLVMGLCTLCGLRGVKQVRKVCENMGELLLQALRGKNDYKPPDPLGERPSD